MKTFLSTLIFLAGFLHLAAQEDAWQYYFPDGNATAIVASGNTILVGTYNGLVRFDTLGNKEHILPFNSTIPSQDIRQVAIDASDRWWISYAEGFALFDGTDWFFWSNASAGVSSTVRFLRAAPDGSIYAGVTSAGAVVFQNGVWTALNMANSGLPSNDIRDITFGQDGKAYFATGAGLAIQDGANWTIYNAANTGLTNFNNVKSVAVTTAGVIWVTEGLNRFAKFEAGAWTEYLAADIGLTGVGLSGKVLVDAGDRLWLSFTKSVSVFSDGVWTHQLEAEIGCTLGLNPQLAVDGEGSLWTSWCSLTRFDGQSWTQPATGNSLLPAVYVITQDTEGNMWFAGAGDKSIAKKDLNDNWESYDPFELGASADFNDVWSAHGDASGNVWFAMLNGEILRFDGAEWTLFDTLATTFSIGDTWFADSGPDGSVWFSFVKGPFSALLARYQNGEWTTFSAEEDIPMPAGFALTSIAFTGNTTWFYGAGILVKFDGTNWENVAIPVNSGSAFSSIRKIGGAPDGGLWLSTEFGLFRYDGANWTNLSSSNSDIPTDDVYSVVFDQADGMYIGYIPDPAGPNCAVGRNGEWMELVPPGFESAFNKEPWHTFVDQDNRFWFTGAHPASGGAPGVFVYDPMIVGTEENELLATDLLIFPNPTTGKFTLNLGTNQHEETQLHITNLQGQTVYAASIPATESSTIDLDISHLPAGVYSVTVVQNGSVKTGKVVKG
ncbi:MAG: T9SS type A sorting domain-containing protein [Saprospiraceae bacterium]